jgi:hypothetical protein
MKKPIELADTTFRAYKKRNGATILHLRTHLIVYADADFRTKIKNAQPSLNWDKPEKPSGLSAFMKEFPQCWLKFPGAKQFECEVSYTCFPEARSIQHPTGDGYVTMENKYITDGKCVLFMLFAHVILKSDTNIFGDGNYSGVSMADMKLVLHINFPGLASDKKIVFLRKVPIVRRGLGW